MQIMLNDEPIQVEIIRKNNKNIYMRFSEKNILTVTCSPWVSEKKIKEIIEQNSSSLIKMKERKAKESDKNIFFYYLGKPYTRIFDGETTQAYFLEDNIIAKDEKTLLKFYQTECNRVFQSEIERILPSFSNIPPFTLKIRNMRTRWGVNNQGSHTITLNSELLKKDLDLLDYVIIHELCHFYEANHSKQFWDHVARYYPKYKEARKRLRDE